MTYKLYVATLDDGVTPDFTTAYPHMRGAMVNWLYRNKVPVMNALPDERIREAFIHMVAASGKPVRILELDATVVGNADVVDGELAVAGA